MQFNLEVHLIIEGTGIASRGRFSARHKGEISSVAHQYIQSIKRETGYRKTFIEMVIVNGAEDITEEVREIANKPIPPMDDIFW
ncbi:hypothetical protein [Neobacillus cucumis]|uniref:Uncharacterized protein n=1 Tax=Neobacillus cucumis TaxID=1740721 RepID=A0A2N5HCS0_9BACI|nr:hypothetical protein [Neobacillus cucumis]PLS03313.1 hypothetical protein CVD27_15160 [Neobacillus cucumis]